MRIEEEEEEVHHHPAAAATDGGILRSIRSVPPSDFVLKIESFSHLSSMLRNLKHNCRGARNLDPKKKNHKHDYYQSGIFQVGGYQWRLWVYPDGNKKRGGEGYLSVYLALQVDNGSYNFPLGWEVNVYFKLFLYDQLRDNYTTIQDLNGEIRRFHRWKTEHGFAKLIPLATFWDTSKGYLKNDTCIFGAEVFVVQNKRPPQHCLSMMDPLNTIPMSWSLKNFSKLNKKSYYSDIFYAGGKRWKFEIYPKGDRLNEGRLSVYLHLVDSPTSFMSWFRREKQVDDIPQLPQFPHDGGFYVKLFFLVHDQLYGDHRKKLVTKSFESAGWSTSAGPIECGDLILLSELSDQSKGFLMNDTLVIGANYSVVCEVKNT